MNAYNCVEFRYPLIDKNLTKANCLELARRDGLLPKIYENYNYNNCVGCVKGGIGYWLQIKNDYPEVFERFAKLEREIGHSILSKDYLDELQDGRGRQVVTRPECDMFCSLLE
ncbi:MAG: hypothetical protein FWF56_03640 [Firmicutes bacterium]|nr:hypothetical protein [Bacillota bacterium]